MQFSPRSLGQLVPCSWSSMKCLVWVPSCEVSLMANQILAGYSHKLCATISQHILQSGYHCPSKGFVTGLVFWQPTENSRLYQRCQLSCTVKTQCRLEPHFSMFKYLCRCCLQQQGLDVKFVENNLQPWQQTVFLGIPKGSL